MKGNFPRWTPLFLPNDNRMSCDESADPPAINHAEVAKAPRNLDGSASTISGLSDAVTKSFSEGDFVTGIIDITNVRTHVIPPVRTKDETKGRKNHVVSAFLYFVDDLIRPVRAS